MSPLATYPGTVTPVRGLAPFAESERDILFGRDRERDDLSRLIIGEGFRAGLLYGEPGVGKTSLLRAGLVPHLRDHGVVALVCEDLAHPVESFAQAVTAATGVDPNTSEPPMSFLARVVGQALAGQLYLFILDEVDVILRRRDERVIGELGDLFARVVSRSGGRARFLFSCASERLHLFGALERRTGSLFPPSSRYELLRLEVRDAATVIDRTLALAGIALSPELPRHISEVLGGGAPVLPADLQIALLAIRELQLTSKAAIDKIGGAGELEAAWLTHAAAATGNERAALRLLAEVSRATAAEPMTTVTAATRASLDPALAGEALSVLGERGVVLPVATADGGEPAYALAHEILAPRVREVAAPARASARRAFELLGSKAAAKKRLSLGEWWALRREKIAPSTPAERAVLDRTKRLFVIAGGAILAAPVVFVAVILIAMSGQYFFDVSASAGGDHVVVRKGRPSLSWASWISPGYGDEIADTGLVRGTVSPAAWQRIANHEVSGSVDGDAIAHDTRAVMRPSLSGLIDYATDGSETALANLRKAAKGPAEMIAFLEALAPIARGGPAEVALIEQALKDVSPAVKTAALKVAAAAAARRPGSYRETLAAALAADDPELRRLALAAVRALPGDAALTLYRTALAQEPGPEARGELFGLVASQAGAQAPDPAAAAAILANPDTKDAPRKNAQDLLRRAFSTTPDKAAAAAGTLAANAKAPAGARVLALGLILDLAPAESHADLVDDVKAALGTRTEAVRAAALPAYARVSPDAAALDLAPMVQDASLSDTMRVAMALAWGEIARAKKDIAEGALETLLKDGSAKVRAAAARAYGNIGRQAQVALIDLIKSDRFEVAVGAAYGLARSVAAGGSRSRAIYGINQLWRDKGRSRRAAADVFVKLARTEPDAVASTLARAARDDDDSLHPVAAHGLCNAVAAGSRRAEHYLSQLAKSDSAQVRRIVIHCAIDHADHAEMAAEIARELVSDGDAAIRVSAAQVLATLARSEAPPARVGPALTALCADRSREVRILAIAGLEALGANASDKARAALSAAFDGADETERLTIISTAAAISVPDLVKRGIADPSPLVRIAAIDAAIATQTDVLSVISSALTDPDAQVRRAALLRLGKGEHGLAASDVGRALALAVRDPDESISALALTILARLADGDEVTARLGRLLSSRSEHDRALAAAAVKGLAARAPKAAAKLLEPLLDDPAHDVRVAMIPSLATAYARMKKPDELAAMMAHSATRPTRRLTAAAAFLVLAETDAGAESAKQALSGVADNGPPLAADLARVSLGLLASGADGQAFLTFIAP